MNSITITLDPESITRGLILWYNMLGLLMLGFSIFINFVTVKKEKSKR